jgi:hypothetical protein
MSHSWVVVDRQERHWAWAGRKAEIVDPRKRGDHQRAAAPGPRVIVGAADDDLLGVGVAFAVARVLAAQDLLEVLDELSCWRGIFRRQRPAWLTTAASGARMAWRMAGKSILPVSIFQGARASLITASSWPPEEWMRLRSGTMAVALFSSADSISISL